LGSSFATKTQTAVNNQPRALAESPDIFASTRAAHTPSFCVLLRDSSDLLKPHTFHDNFPTIMASASSGKDENMESEQELDGEGETIFPCLDLFQNVS